MTKTEIAAQDLRNYLNYIVETEGGELARNIHELTDRDISALFHKHLEYKENLQRTRSQSRQRSLKAKKFKIRPQQERKQKIPPKNPSS